MAERLKPASVGTIGSYTLRLIADVVFGGILAVIIAFYAEAITLWPALAAATFGSLTLAVLRHLIGRYGTFGSTPFWEHWLLAGLDAAAVFVALHLLESRLPGWITTTWDTIVSLWPW